MAYAEFLCTQGEHAQAHVWGTPQLEVLWLLETFGLYHALGPVEDQAAQVVLLDASEPKDLPGSFIPEQVREVIDHRLVHCADQFVQAKVQIELVGSAATLVAERFFEAQIMPSRESALFLLGGIISNTHNFTAVTTPRDHAMADWLRPIAQAPENLAERMFQAKSDLSGDRLREAMMGDSKLFEIHGRTVLISQLEIFGVQVLLAQRRLDIEGILKEMQEVQNADVAMVNLIELKDNLLSILFLDASIADVLAKLPDSTCQDRLCTSPTINLRKKLVAWMMEH